MVAAERPPGPRTPRPSWSGRVEHGDHVLGDRLDRAGAGARSESPMPRFSSRSPARRKRGVEEPRAPAAAGRISRWLTNPATKTDPRRPRPSSYRRSRHLVLRVADRRHLHGPEPTVPAKLSPASSSRSRPRRGPPPPAPPPWPASSPGFAGDHVIGLLRDRAGDLAARPLIRAVASSRVSSSRVPVRTSVFPSSGPSPARRSAASSSIRSPFSRSFAISSQVRSSASDSAICRAITGPTPSTSSNCSGSAARSASIEPK